MPRSGWHAAAAVVLSATVGLVINFFTDQPTWALGAGVFGLVACGAAVAVFEVRQSPDAGIEPPPAPAARGRAAVPTGNRNAVQHGSHNRIGMSGGFVLGALFLVGATVVAVLFVVLRFGALAEREGRPASAAQTEPPAPAQALPSADDPQAISENQCVANGGTDEKPTLNVVECEGGSLYVMRRINGKATGQADAERKCSRIADYTKWYFYDSAQNSLDYVLCMGEMPR